MRENLCSIPVSEVFEPKDGCPVCRLFQMLEERMVDYIMGAAMMEPDIRLETNRLGFCHRHLQLMRAKNNRLSLALQLETRLMELKRGLGKESFAKKGVNVKPHDCYVCGKIEESLSGFLTTICHLYETQPEFRTLYSEQECMCYPHYLLLCEYAEKKIGKKIRGEFRTQTQKLVESSLDQLQKDLRAYCDLYDYRNKTPPSEWGALGDSIERAIWWTTSLPADEKQK